MKKILVFGLAVLVLIFAGVHFMNRGGDVRNVERMTAENTLYTQEEIDTAMDIAIKAFSQGFEGCKLLTIAYDEEETLAEIQCQRERHGELKLMVLVSSFHAGENAESCFERDMIYTGWKWILQNGDDGWKMINWGYA